MSKSISEHVVPQDRGYLAKRETQFSKEFIVDMIIL